jgi:hypothetical protein
MANNTTEELFGRLLNSPKLEKTVYLLLLNTHLNLKLQNLGLKLHPLLKTQLLKKG